VNIFVCNHCGNELEVEDLIYPTCVWCLWPYEPVAKVYIHSGPKAYDVQEEFSARPIPFRDEDFQEFMTYAHRELRIDKVQRKDTRAAKQPKFTKMRESNLSILLDKTTRKL
jgi:hypothetical protein